MKARTIIKSRLSKLIAAAVVLATFVAFAPGVARAVTPITFDGGTGECFLLPDTRRNVIAPSVTRYSVWSVPVVVKSWVRLLDMNGNPVSQWFLQGTVTLPVRGVVTWAPFTLTTSYQYVRVQRELDYYWNNAVFQIQSSIITSYRSWMSLLIGGAYVRTPVGTHGYCS